MFNISGFFSTMISPFYNSSQKFYPVLIENKVLKWADSKGIMQKATPATQVNKLLEEVNELKEAINKGDREEILLELGDVYVVCTILSEMLMTDRQEALNLAYNKISKRTGKMVNGVFVKD